MENSLEKINLGEITSQWSKHQGIATAYEKSTTSTNELAKADAFKSALSEELKVYLTDHQSQGRGRGQNTWSQGRIGSSLLSSWSYQVYEAPQPTMTPRIGLALYRSVQAVWPFLNWSLKAPNDLYCDEKKIAGLLIETITQGDEFRLIVGLGFNVLESPPDIPSATSLMETLPMGVPLLGDDWAAWLDRWLLEMTDAVSRPDENLTSTECESLKWALNSRPTIENEILKVLPHGGLETNKGAISWMEL